MKKKSYNNINVESFESVQEFISVINKRTNNEAFSCHKESERGSLMFTGSQSWEEAQNLFKHGYKEGAKDLLTCKSSVKVLNPAKKVTTFQDVCGFAPIVPNAIIGLPQSMVNSRAKVKQARVINVLLDIDVTGDTDKEVLTLGGKNIYSLVKSLELKGVRVNLSLMHSTYVSKANNYACLFVKIKDSKQAINPQLIAYPIIHPSFFRRHVFKWIETSEYTNYKSLTSGYGPIGRYEMQYKSGSVMRCFLDNKVITKDTYYIDVVKASKAQSIQELQDVLGIA